MPRRHSLHPSAAPVASSATRRDEPGMEVAIATLALFVAALVGIAGAISSRQPGLFALAAVLIAVPPVSALLAARARRRRAQRPAIPQRSAWDESDPDPLTGVPVLADFERELQRVLRRGEPDVTVLRLALVPVGGAADAYELRRRLVLAAVGWQEVLRPDDRLARVAEDRFAVLLPECPLGAAARVVDRLRDATPPGAVCAVGAASWDRAETGAALLGRAAAALESAPQLRGGDVLRDPARVAAMRATDISGARRDGDFDRAAESLAWLLGAPAITIALVDDRFEHVIGAFGAEDELAARASTVAEHALGHQCLITGRPLVATDAARHPALFAHHRVVSGAVGACASVPLVAAGGHVVGTISATREGRHAWSRDELRLLSSTAARVASELERIPRVVAA